MPGRGKPAVQTILLALLHLLALRFPLPFTPPPFVIFVPFTLASFNIAPEGLVPFGHLPLDFMSIIVLPPWCFPLMRLPMFQEGKSYRRIGYTTG